MEGGNIGLWDRDTRLARGWMGVEVGGILFSHLKLQGRGEEGGRGKKAAPEGKTGAGKIVINGTMWVSLEGGGGRKGGGGVRGGGALQCQPDQKEEGVGVGFGSGATWNPFKLKQALARKKSAGEYGERLSVCSSPRLQTKD